MRVISLPTIPLWMALADQSHATGRLAISMERFTWTQKTVAVGSSGSRFSGKRR